MDSPIEKITDPSFTSSAKGLMTLFCIGLIHMVIGVHPIEETSIQIPWFPTINFEHPERLFYLYWGLIWYALYRYTLHHKVIFNKYYFESLVRVLAIGQKGEKLVRKSIYLSETGYYKVSHKTPDNSHLIDIEAFSDGESDTAISFCFYFSEEYSFQKIKCWEDTSFATNDLVTHHDKICKNWGLTYIGEIGSYDVNETFRISSWRLRYQIRWLTICSYMHNLKYNKDIFDTTVPIALNVSLFVFWLGSSICQYLSKLV